MKWISLKERFPKEKENVLVYFDSFCGEEVKKEIRIAWWEDFNWYWYPCECCCPSGYEVLYWMPLPDKPI